jgi:hypothetical protein
MDPLRGMAAVLRLARDAGVEVRGGTPVLALERAGAASSRPRPPARSARGRW